MSGNYYVPAQSRMPIFMAIALFLLVWGAGTLLNGARDGTGGGGLLLLSGLSLLLLVMFFWFYKVIKENFDGLTSSQLKKSYVWGMGWFIFSEVMFFFGFFFALFYVRLLAVPWLGGDTLTNEQLWPGFEENWPLMQNPDPHQFKGPSDVISPWQIPLVNTLLLLTSSYTAHIAHEKLKHDLRKQFNAWLILTIILGLIFLSLQAYEYGHAYNDLGLTLQSGIYGTTFFLLTGFHGLHVTIGAIMLVIMLLRSVANHFEPQDHFGFQAASWYWHFVDVVWVFLFIFVYVL